MASIITATSLTINSLIVYQVRAQNAKGWGVYSEVNTFGSTIETLPSQMAPLTFNPATSTNTQIVLTWSAVPTGLSSGGTGVAIASYNIYWDAGAGGPSSGFTLL